MCGRYVAAGSADGLASVFDVGLIDGELPAADWNVAPTKQVPVVVVRDNRRVLTAMRWGLVPGWATDPSIGSRLVNARVETAAEKPAFRDALALRRCLLPADGWYEWQRRPDGNRQPHYLSRDDGETAAFAGLWERWYAADGRPLTTVTILTGAASEEIAAVHDRAPIVLDREYWSDWLDPTQRDAADVLAAKQPTMRAWPVSDAVGDYRASGPDLVRPVAVNDQPPLF